jgi:hypothetical protein
MPPNASSARTLKAVLKKSSHFTAHIAWTTLLTQKRQVLIIVVLVASIVRSAQVRFSSYQSTRKAIKKRMMQVTRFGVDTAVGPPLTQLD